MKKKLSKHAVIETFEDEKVYDSSNPDVFKTIQMLSNEIIHIRAKSANSDNQRDTSECVTNSWGSDQLNPICRNSSKVLGLSKRTSSISLKKSRSLNVFKTSMLKSLIHRTKDVGRCKSVHRFLI